MAGSKCKDTPEEKTKGAAKEPKKGIKKPFKISKGLKKSNELSK